MPARALIVDPDAEQTALLERTLLGVGYGVSVVHDGAVALSETRRQLGAARGYVRRVPRVSYRLIDRKPLRTAREARR